MKKKYVKNDYHFVDNVFEDKTIFISHVV